MNRFLSTFIFVVTVACFGYAEDTTFIEEALPPMIPSTAETVNSPDTIIIDENAANKQQEEVLGDLPAPLPNPYITETTPETRISPEIEQAIRSGKALTTAGMVVHFIGFGLSLFPNLMSSEVENPGLFAMLIMGNAMAIGGPIIAGSGASHVEKRFRANNIGVNKPQSWPEYGIGWGLKGASVGLSIGAMFADEVSTGVTLLLCSIATGVVSEVMWARSVIHAKSYVNKCDRIAENSALDFSFSPQIVPGERYGVMAVVDF